MKKGSDALGNRIGVIFHNDWEEYSPLLYSHNGADSIPYRLQEFLKKYAANHEKNSHDGHLYNCSHLMAGFISSLDYDTHMRIENLHCDSQHLITEAHEYSNCFEGGCWLVNVSEDHFGDIETDCMKFYMENDNLVTDEFENVEQTNIC